MAAKLTQEQKAELKQCQDDIDRLNEAFTMMKNSGNEISKDVQAKMKATKIVNTLYKIVGVV